MAYEIDRLFKDILNFFTGYALTCFCLGHCPKFPNDPSKNGTCEAKPGAKCFSAVEEVYDPESGKYEPERTYGCLPPDETGLLQCQGLFTIFQLFVFNIFYCSCFSGTRGNFLSVLSDIRRKYFITRF